MSSNATQTNGSSGQPNDGLTPLFYERPVPVSPEAQQNFKIRGPGDFTFAARANMVPLTLPEFGHAARHCPIIFVGDDMVPTMVVGLRADDNLFINVKGEWEPGQYVPAYVRRFPFILLGAATDQRLSLGVEETARSSKPDARPLFEGDKETDVVRDALSICEQFHGAYLFTAEFTRALSASGITESRTLELNTPEGKQSVGTFVAINEDKFKELPDETILEWRKRGWLHAVYFQLQSMNNWDFLFARAANRMAIAAAIA